MGLWDRIKRVFRPAPVEIPPEPPTEPAFRPRMIYANPPLPARLRPRPVTPPPAPATERNLALEAAIAADPSAVEPYLVYADWLEARGDPRADLIVRCHRMTGATGDELAELARSVDELRRRHGPHLLGPTVASSADVSTHELRLGFVRAVWIRGMERDDQLRWIGWIAAEDHPATRFLEVVSGVVDVDAAAALVARAGRGFRVER